MIEMPIHSSWKSMASAMIHNASYCKRSPKKRCYKLTTGKKICGCAGGWSVFFATLRKRGWDETKPRSKKVTETVFEEAVREVFDEMVIREWWEAKQKPEKVEETTPKDDCIKWAAESASTSSCHKAMKGE